MIFYKDLSTLLISWWIYHLHVYTRLITFLLLLLQKEGSIHTFLSYEQDANKLPNIGCAQVTCQTGPSCLKYKYIIEFYNIIICFHYRRGYIFAIFGFIREEKSTLYFKPIFKIKNTFLTTMFTLSNRA